MHKYFVKNVEQITPSTLLLTLHRKEGSSGLFSFQPGQYAAISFVRHRRPTQARCFSIVSSPNEQDILQFSMRTKGRFTKALGGLKEDDEVSVRGPFGGFVFDQERDKHAILMAGGIGITPFISMVRYVSRLNLTNKVTLIYSCQKQDDVPFFDELAELRSINPNLKVVYVIGQGEVDRLAPEEVHSGNISSELIEQIVDHKYKDKTFFMCGPPPFMNAMLKTLEAKGAPKSNLITEAFSQGPNTQTGKVISWPANMYILSALGVVVGSFAVMMNDLLKALPASTLLDPNSINRTTVLKNSRQADLDKLVNELPEQEITSPETHAVTKALSEYQESMQQPQTQVQSPPSTVIIKKNTTTPPTTTTNTPLPEPKCTTSQSGVTTCL